MVAEIIRLLLSCAEPNMIVITVSIVTDAELYMIQSAAASPVLPASHTAELHTPTSRLTCHRVDTTQSERGKACRKALISNSIVSIDAKLGGSTILSHIFIHFRFHLLLLTLLYSYRK